VMTSRALAKSIEPVTASGMSSPTLLRFFRSQALSLH
jgi:hypothetical protein